MTLPTWDVAAHPRESDGQFAKKTVLPPTSSVVHDATAAAAEEASDGTADRELTLNEFLSAYSPDPGAPEATQARNWRELYRLRSDLKSAEDKLCGELADKIGEGTVECGDGATATVKIGGARDDWSHETLWTHVEGRALARSESDPAVTPERAVTETARSYLAAGSYKTDGLRGMGLKPGHYAEYKVRLDDADNPVETLVPTEMEASTGDEVYDRAEIARMYAGASMADWDAPDLADRIREVQVARTRVHTLQTEHESELLSRFKSGEARTYPGVGTVTRRSEGHWAGWKHDQLWGDVTENLESRAPEGAGPKERHALAVDRLRDVIGDGPGWKKRPLKADNLLSKVHVTRRGRVSLIVD